MPACCKGSPPHVLSPEHLMLCLISPQEEEKEKGENSDTEEQVPEAPERKGHDSSGQTGVENVQSAQAVELAGTTPESEQGKEVRGSCPAAS